MVNLGATILLEDLSILAISLSTSVDTSTIEFTKSTGFESITFNIASSKDFPNATAQIPAPDAVTTALTSKNSLITSKPLATVIISV